MKRTDILSPSTPLKTNPVTRALGYVVLKMAGWRIVGTFPDEKKLLIIAAPHTSNWDYILAMAAKLYVGVRVRYLMKKELDVWPLSILVRGLGGIPVERGTKTDIIEQTCDWLNGQDQAWLGMSPEGTRSKTAHWKTGFLRIAQGANLPIVVVGIDGAKKQLILDKLIPASELRGANIKAKARELKTYCDEKFVAIRPEKQ
ncbi:MAG TPA: glycerol acyltransferase [Hellea balneolensis]|uniref:Glycerol acyltransferase n=1 Tax=Hellea balneolensis TaxID=287478 RepID=A0A7C3FZA4_9PROT|nr:glycerol acyltransferase [Hellea balneolensis]